ncbi:DUF456 domain-containing protein [Nesterenkonia alba]|uniref:DUF456 domain-containing protein n=1 Tax=Nesterenkonia alba TaxID=515814 RepID=UPI0003B56705|nr:DUF456 domain-containing protein [Nesterenkonia alba]
MLESTGAEALTTVIAGLILLLGAAGVILPVIPGSLVIILTLLIWAVLLGGPAAWTAAIIGVVLAGIGWSASTVLTGRALHREQIPRGPILVALAAALVGLVLLPPLGLFLGFAVGLFGAEYFRRDHQAGEAARASMVALRAMGLGIVIEFLLAGCAVSAFLIGTLIHFL